MINFIIQIRLNYGAMVQILSSIFILLIFISCGDASNTESTTNKDDTAQATSKNSKSKSSSNSKENLNQILDLLNASLFEKCASFPLIIQSPYMEFANNGTVGGIYFGGSNLEMNKQYSYYSNQNAQMFDQKSWATERGNLSNVKLESKIYDGLELPIITGIWKSNQNTSGDVLIRPIISGENSGKFYYRMYTNSWEVYGYKDFSIDDFNKVLKLMCNMASLNLDEINQNMTESDGNDELLEYQSHSIGSINVDLPLNFSIEKMYDDSSPDYCDFSIKMDNIEIIQIHSLLKSRFETTSMNELYESAINNSEIEISYKTQKDNWFVVSGVNYLNQNIIYWKRVVGDMYISDIKFEYPKELKSQIDPIIGTIAKSFTSE